VRRAPEEGVTRETLAGPLAAFDAARQSQAAALAPEVAEALALRSSSLHTLLGVNAQVREQISGVLEGLELARAELTASRPRPTLLCVVSNAPWRPSPAVQHPVRRRSGAREKVTPSALAV